MNWISVRGWRQFQHYDPTKRNLPWIKNYTELLDDDGYMSLTPHQALVLHRLWLAYAKSRCQLDGSTASLSRRLNLRVTKRTLEALNHAGFIDIVASKLLADGYQAASTEIEKEIEKEKDLLSYSPPARPPIDPEREAAAIAQLEAMGEHVSLESKLRASIALAESRKNEQ